MAKKFVAVACVVLALCFIVSGISYAADSAETGSKAKNSWQSFWQKLFNYPANVTSETAGVATDAVKGVTNTATDELKRTGRVTSGKLGETGDLVTKPLVGTAETTKTAIEGTVAIPVKANKEEPK